MLQRRDHPCAGVEGSHGRRIAGVDKHRLWPRNSERAQPLTHRRLKVVGTTPLGPAFPRHRHGVADQLFEQLLDEDPAPTPSGIHDLEPRAVAAPQHHEVSMTCRPTDGRHTGKVGL